MDADQDHKILWCDDYYEIICIISKEKNSGKWLAKTRVKRKDTDEYINAGFTALDLDKDKLLQNVETRANTSLLLEIKSLGVPIDWNSEIRHTLLFCKKLNSEIGEFGSYSIDSLFPKKNDERYLSKYSDFWRKIIKETVFLCGKIETLSADARIDLLTLPEYVFEDPSDAWSLDEIDARLIAFEFFLNPSDKEREVHFSQKHKLADRFIELGWK